MGGRGVCEGTLVQEDDYLTDFRLFQDSVLYDSKRAAVDFA